MTSTNGNRLTFPYPQPTTPKHHEDNTIELERWANSMVVNKIIPSGGMSISSVPLSTGPGATGSGIITLNAAAGGGSPRFSTLGNDINVSGPGPFTLTLGIYFGAGSAVPTLLNDCCVLAMASGGAGMSTTVAGLGATWQRACIQNIPYSGGFYVSLWLGYACSPGLSTITITGDCSTAVAECFAGLSYITSPLYSAIGTYGFAPVPGPVTVGPITVIPGQVVVSCSQFVADGFYTPSYSSGTAVSLGHASGGSTWASSLEYDSTPGVSGSITASYNKTTGSSGDVGLIIAALNPA